MGLGDSAARYLKANQQKVISFELGNGNVIPEDIYRVANCYGPLDFIINNSNYYLLSEIDLNISSQVETTATLLRGLAPYLRHQPPGSIINLPPQFCSTNIVEREASAKSLKNLNWFLACLKNELCRLNCGVHFIEPGERFMQF